MFVLNYNYCNISGVLFKAFFLLSTQHHIPFRLRFSDIENYVLQLLPKGDLQIFQQFIDIVYGSSCNKHNNFLKIVVSKLFILFLAYMYMRQLLAVLDSYRIFVLVCNLSVRSLHITNNN